MTYFPPADQSLPTPGAPASQEVYEAAHRNFAIGYSDVVLRNPEDGRFFFPVRGVEPEKGSPWFIGGRMAVGEAVQDSAARHVRHDTGLPIPSGRFYEVSHFGIAHVTDREDREPLVRHAQNTVLVADLKPDEVTALNRRLTDAGLSAEYNGGEWFDPAKEDARELPDPLRQFLRDFFTRQVTMDALRDLAAQEMAEYVEEAGPDPRTP